MEKFFHRPQIYFNLHQNWQTLSSEASEEASQKLSWIFYFQKRSSITVKIRDESAKQEVRSYLMYQKQTWCTDLGPLPESSFDQWGAL